MTKKVIKQCHHCKGSGKEPIDKFLGVLSFGVTALIDLGMSADCSYCDGSGMLAYKVKTND